MKQTEGILFALHKNADGFIIQYPENEAFKHFHVSFLKSTGKGDPFSMTVFRQIVQGWKRQGADMENDTINAIVSPNTYSISWALLEPRPDNSNVYFIAAACIMFYNETLPSKIAHLCGFFVEPVLQHKGLGKMYIERLKKIWSVIGIKRVVLAAEHNKAGFWKKCGFQTSVPSINMPQEELLMVMTAIFQPMFGVYALNLQLAPPNSFLQFETK